MASAVSEIKWSPCIWSPFKLALPRLPKNLLCTGYLYDCPGYALVTKSVWRRHWAALGECTRCSVKQGLTRHRKISALRSSRSKCHVTISSYLDKRRQNLLQKEKINQQ